MNAAEAASVGIAAAALVWTVYRDIANRRALGRESQARKDADAREEQRRNEEIALLQRQVAQTEDREREAKKARLVATPGGTSGSSNGVDHRIVIRNIGGAVADNVAVWLTEDESGIGTEPSKARPLTAKRTIPPLVPGEQPTSFTLTQTGTLAGNTQGDGWIVAAWKDASGERVDKVGTTRIFR